jgi:hypothetical protein
MQFLDLAASNGGHLPDARELTMHLLHWLQHPRRMENHQRSQRMLWDNSDRAKTGAMYRKAHQGRNQQRQRINDNCHLPSIFCPALSRYHAGTNLALSAVQAIWNSI